MQSEAYDIRSVNETPERIASRGLPLLLALAVLLRVTWPFAAMQTHVDEGGWPLAVRLFATEGLITFDFHKAPLYHLLLGAPFAVFPPTLLTGRFVSVILSLVSLALLWRVGERVGPRGTGLWAALLWASCFPASDVAGRALIEPLQIVFALWLLLAIISPSPRRTLYILLATAALLWTKANAVVLLPPLLLGAFWDGESVWRESRRAQFIGISLGVMFAVAGFAALYLWDAETFRLAWGSTVVRADVATPSGALRIGRFVMNPQSILAGLGFVAMQTPLMAIAGGIGAWRAMARRQSSGLAFALVTMTAFVLVQAAQPHQYFALLYPLLALLAGTALRELYLLTRTNTGEPSLLSQWPLLLLALASVEGMGRDVVSRSMDPASPHRASERLAVQWMQEQLPRDARVAGAPYLLMQLRNPVRSIFDITSFDKPLDANALAAADWFIVDRLEWEGYVLKRGRSIEELRAEFAACCTAEYTDENVRVYRVTQRE